MSIYRLRKELSDQPNFLAIPERKNIARRSKRYFLEDNRSIGRRERLVRRHHKRLIHTNIHLKYKEGYRFTVERRRVGYRIYSYLYRQKGRDKSQNREHVYLRAKDLLDYRNRVLREQAQDEVYKRDGIRWMQKSWLLTPCEIRTLEIITGTSEDRALTNRIAKHWESSKRQPVNPVIERYRKKLGIRLLNQYGWFKGGRHSAGYAKKVLKAARRTFMRRAVRIVDRPYLAGERL